MSLFRLLRFLKPLFLMFLCIWLVLNGHILEGGVLGLYAIIIVMGYRLLDIEKELSEIGERLEN